MNYKVAVLAAFFCFGALNAATNGVTPTIIARSQGSDAARKLVGLANKTHLYRDENYYTLAATAGYGKTFRAEKLAQCLFGDDIQNCKTIKIQGSNVENRDEHAWLADYFYLAPDYDGSFTIDPVIQNFTANLDLFVGLDDWAHGLYVRAYGPITWSRWDLNFKEVCDVETTNSFRAGYFSHEAIENNQLLTSFESYACGNSPQNTSGTSAQPSIGVAFNGLQSAKIKPCAQSRTGFAELHMELGYDFAQCDDYHFGLNIQAGAPTGGKRKAELAFDSVIGNGNHWEVGGGLTAHYIFWKGQGEDKHFGFYLDANINHLVTAKEERTFDLCGRSVSRYMLAQKLSPAVNFLQAGSSATSTANLTSPVAQFAGVFAPVANLSTVKVDVSVGVQADIAAMFNYTANNWGFDLGYNFWYRSCENIKQPKVCSDQCSPSLCTDVDTWAFKGDAAVFGFISAISGELSQNDPIALSATQCGATINKGTNDTATSGEESCPGDNILGNCGVDNAAFAYGQEGAGTAARLEHTTPTDGALSSVIKTSSEPKFINCCDLNLQETRGLSHKVFGNIAYNWDNDWNPFIAVGASAEWGKTECNPCAPALDCDTDCENSCNTTCCSDCLDCAPSQWAVWLKGGINFN